MSVKVKEREICGWTAGQWPGGSRAPGACDKEKLASMSGASEVKKLAGQAM